jgi:RNA polymerase subunit RPABC4/transcription elongation factor Spt4
MALINCSECGKRVSEKASLCPNCGHPVNTTEHEIRVVTDPAKPLKVEPVLVSKKWKKVKLFSWLVIIFGFIFPAFLPGSLDKRQTLGWIIVFLGVATLIIGKIGAWYEDKRAR